MRHLAYRALVLAMGIFMAFSLSGCGLIAYALLKKKLKF